MHPTERGALEYFDPKHRAHCWSKVIFVVVVCFVFIKEIRSNAHKRWGLTFSLGEISLKLEEVFVCGKNR